MATGNLVARRTFLGRSVVSLGAVALGTLSQQRWACAASAQVDPLHQMPRAKRVIFLCMAGGPSHLETLDYKPKLAELNGQPMPASFTQGQPIAQLQGQNLKCLGPQHPFGRFGQSGQQICQVFRHIAGIADELCIVRSLRTEQINHDPAHTFMNTGSAISGRPSMGAWIVYGLGRMTDDLPGFVVLTSSGGGQDQPIAARQWHSGFLPSQYQGVQFQSVGSPVLYSSRPRGVDESDQRTVVDAVTSLNQLYGQEHHDAEVATRIAQYEMAFRMQASVPGLMDFSDEPQSILDMYGTRGGDGSFAGNCLLARRLAERGVRFIQLYHRGWDHHGGVKQGVEVAAGHVDRASAALVQDLKQRGMLDDTLVIWTGEFGRTPMAQGNGRDHHIKGFSMWMAGGGVRAGTSYGATDDLGYNAVENVFHVHDLHATMLHLLGIDHERLTFPFQGREYRLTDVAGKVVHDILA
ncbi:MAG: DUF1501 domain-containing protein [Planctomycetales bacterium]|nr:DUF1501 domain-containing protein [Planctomycetales bacterium]MCA9166677.1 DUF1501 domain-containing protein [Planctomycetales bacterium]